MKMKLGLLGSALISAIGVAAPLTSHATNTYFSYVGPQYTDLGGKYTSGGPYGLYLETMVTLSGAALDNLNDATITSDVKTYAFEDAIYDTPLGDGKLINKVSGATAFDKDFEVSTSATGQITSWFMNSCGKTCNVQMQTNWDSPTGFTPGADFSETSANFAGTFGFEHGTEGVWYDTRYATETPLQVVHSTCPICTVTPGKTLPGGNHLQYYWVQNPGTGASSEAILQNVKPPAPAALSAVPETGSWTMMVLGFGAIGGWARTRRLRAQRPVSV